MRGIRRCAAVGGLSIGLLLAAGCVLGDEQAPGCSADEDCGEGLTCRAGACFRLTTGRLSPHDPKDAGASDASDASSE